MKRSACFLILAILVLSIDAAAQQADDSFKIVGYYSLRAALTADLDTVPFEGLTHVNLAFLNPDSLGVYTADLSGLKAFIDEAHKHDVKVLFSIGGGGRYPHYHRHLRDEHRPALIRNLMAEVLRYGVDGVDVDLEGSAIDESYEPFVIELARALREHDKLITAAIAVYYKDQLSDKALAQYDFVNVMSYDRTGPWRPEKPGPHAAYSHAVDDLDYFANERRIPAAKMTLGVPFYGYGFAPDSVASVVTMDFDEIVSTFPGAQWTDEWPLPDGRIMYYNGIPTIRKKTALARAKASGIMIWQLRGDAKGEHSLLRTIREAAGP